MNASLAQTIRGTFEEVLRQQLLPSDLGHLSEDTKLLDTGLDSLGFAIVVVKLEQTLGCDPFLASDEPYYPTTFGEFVNFYDKHLSP